MNDELNGQLASRWPIPAYARSLLWVETPAETVQAEGERGLFTLSTPADVLLVRWGGADGPPLVQLRWQVDSLGWEGAVRIGGYIDAMHVTELDGWPEAVTILQVGGQPLKSGLTPYPGRAQRSRAPYLTPGFHDGLVDDVDESVTTWISLADNSTLILAQDALVSKLPVHLYGTLAAED